MAMEMFDKVAGRMDISDALVRHILRTPDYVCMPSSYEAMRKDLLESSEVKRDYVKEAKINQMIDSWEKDMPLHEIIREKLPSTNCKMVVFSSDITQLKKNKRLIANLMEKAGISYKGYDYYHSGNRKTMEGLEKFKSEKTRSRAQIIFCIDMLNEGVHVPGVQAAFFLRPTDSKTVFYQQLGRIMSAGSNDCTVVFDMVDNMYSRNMSDLAQDVHDCQTRKIDSLSMGTKEYVDPESVSFRVDDYLKVLRGQKEKVAPRQRQESFAEKLERIAANYTENGRIRIRVYNTQSRNDENWFYLQTKKYAMDALSPEERRLMDRLKFDQYVPPEKKEQIELDRFIKNFKLHHQDISSMSIVDQAYYKRLAFQLSANKLDLAVYRKLSDAGVAFVGYKVPVNYKIAQAYKLDTSEEVMAQMKELERTNRKVVKRQPRVVKTQEEKDQNKLRKVVASKTEGESYKVNGGERRFGGVKSREEIEALKRSAATAFMNNTKTVSRRIHK